MQHPRSERPPVGSVPPRRPRREPRRPARRLPRWPALAAAVLLAVQPEAARAAPALAFDAATGEVTHAHDAFRPWFPASLTKLMTLYLAFEALASGRIAPETTVRISERAVRQPFNTMGWPAGTEITVAEALPILVVKSANDVAVALAETLAGDVESFVAEMNAAAARLAMADTRFVNPNGLLDPRHVTTAHDLALLTAAIVREHPERMPSFALRDATVRGVRMKSHNALLGRLPGADGIKTGYLCASGWNIVASASRDGRRVVAIVLGARREGERETVAGELIEAAFRAPLGEAGPRPTLDTLPRPAETAGPVDMRPYACEGRRPPADIASFGLEGTPPLPRPKP